MVMHSVLVSQQPQWCHCIMTMLIRTIYVSPSQYNISSLNGGFVEVFFSIHLIFLFTSLALIIGIMHIEDIFSANQNSRKIYVYLFVERNCSTKSGYQYLYGNLQKYATK